MTITRRRRNSLQFRNLLPTCRNASQKYWNDTQCRPQNDFIIYNTRSSPARPYMSLSECLTRALQAFKTRDAFRTSDVQAAAGEDASCSTPDGAHRAALPSARRRNRRHCSRSELYIAIFNLVKAGNLAKALEIQI